MTDEVPAAIRYKELTALATTAAERLRRHENARAAELEDTAVDAPRRADEADAQLEQVRNEARKRWNAALEALWHERWFQVDGGMPEPDPQAPPQPAEQSRQEMQQALLQLHEATARQKRRWIRGRT